MHAGVCSYPGYTSVHHLLPDEYIYEVAQNCSVQTETLESANSQILNFSDVTAGMAVCVPAACCSVMACADGSALAPAPSAANGMPPYWHSMHSCVVSGMPHTS